MVRRPDQCIQHKCTDRSTDRSIEWLQSHSQTGYYNPTAIPQRTKASFSSFSSHFSSEIYLLVCLEECLQEFTTRPEELPRGLALVPIDLSSVSRDRFDREEDRSVHRSAYRSSDWLQSLRCRPIDRSIQGEEATVEPGSV